TSPGCRACSSILTRRPVAHLPRRPRLPSRPRPPLLPPRPAPHRAAPRPAPRRAATRPASGSSPVQGLVGRPLGGLPIGGGTITATARQRAVALVFSVLVLAIAVVVFPARPAAAASPSPVDLARASLCTVSEWQSDIRGCIDRLSDVAAARTQCLKAP